MLDAANDIFTSKIIFNQFQTPDSVLPMLRSLPRGAWGPAWGRSVYLDESAVEAAKTIFAARYERICAA